MKGPRQGQFGAMDPNGHFEGPKTGQGVDQGKFLKLAQRVEETLSKETLHPDPKQLDPNHVRVSPLNRMGQSPNVQHIHFGILKSSQVNSFGRARPAVGICVEYKSQAGIEELLEHNRKFAQGNKLLPNIQENHTGPWYGSLACTHLNLAFRCLKQGTQSPIGDLTELLQHPNLKDVIHSGHRWWVLPETLCRYRHVDISLWRNQDQNENQQTHDVLYSNSNSNSNSIIIIIIILIIYSHHHK